MSDTSLCAEMLRRIFPDLDVSDIRAVEAQKKCSAKDHVYEAGSSLASCLLDLQTECRDNISFIFVE